jgi:hypothetical protein
VTSHSLPLFDLSGLAHRLTDDLRKSRSVAPSTTNGHGNGNKPADRYGRPRVAALRLQRSFLSAEQHAKPMSTEKARAIPTVTTTTMTMASNQSTTTNMHSPCSAPLICRMSQPTAKRLTVLQIGPKANKTTSQTSATRSHCSASNVRQPWTSARSTSAAIAGASSREYSIVR